MVRRLSGMFFSLQLRANWFRRRFNRLRCFFLLGILLPTFPSAAETARLLVVPKPGREHELQQWQSRSAHRVTKRFPKLGKVQVLELSPGENPRAAAARYQSSGLVQTVEPDYPVHMLAAPNDPDFRSGNQWFLRNDGRNGGVEGADIRAEEGWEVARDASGIVVAVIDSGIRYTHEDLAANMWVNQGEIPGNGIDDEGNGYIDDVHGINVVGKTGNPTDDLGHGTHVAGILGARGDNNKGIAGVAWSVQLMALKFLDRHGNGTISGAIECIEYAQDHGARIINASWAAAEFSETLYAALESAREAGIIVVAGAGNARQNLDQFPAYPAAFDLDNIVTVCGTGRGDQFDVNYSNFSATRVDVAAPGSDILSTYHSTDGQYFYSSGTSMAAPVVTGIIALMQARYPELTSAQIVGRLLATVDVKPDLVNRCATSGRVNLAKALGAGEPRFEITAPNYPWLLGTSNGERVTSRGLEYAVRNLMPQPIKLEVRSSEAWLEVSAEAGEIPAGGTARLILKLGADFPRAAGQYSAAIAVSDPDAAGFTLKQVVRLLVLEGESEGGINLGLDGVQGRISVATEGDFMVEHSNDLENWNDLYAVRSQGGLVLFADVPGAARKFYRARQLPEQ